MPFAIASFSAIYKGVKETQTVLFKRFETCNSVQTMYLLRWETSLSSLFFGGDGLETKAIHVMVYFVPA